MHIRDDLIPYTLWFKTKHTLKALRRMSSGPIEASSTKCTTDRAEKPPQKLSRSLPRGAARVGDRRRRSSNARRRIRPKGAPPGIACARTSCCWGSPSKRTRRRWRWRTGAHKEQDGLPLPRHRESTGLTFSLVLAFWMVVQLSVVWWG
jgi:hypothetical protein